MWWTSIRTLSEVWVGGRRCADSDSDWGELDHTDFWVVIKTNNYCVLPILEIFPSTVFLSVFEMVFQSTLLIPHLITDCRMYPHLLTPSSSLSHYPPHRVALFHFLVISWDIPSSPWPLPQHFPFSRVFLTFFPVGTKPRIYLPVHYTYMYICILV